MMGGNALKQFGVIRLSDKEYHFIANELKSRLVKLFPELRFDIIPAFKTKFSFGDLDILYSGNNITKFQETILTSFNPTGYINNGDCLSITYPVFESQLFQVDFIKTTPEAHDFSLNYFSYNDLGNLCGRVYKKMGLKFGHKGLLYIVRDPNNENTVIKEILVTRDWDYVINLGKFPKYDHMRFIELKDVFDYVIASPYFNQDIFLLENRNHISRVRDKKRETYMTFLKYIKIKSDLPKFDWNKSDIKSVILNKLFTDFPEFKQTYDGVIQQYINNKRLREKFNGDLVREWTGLEGKELGSFIKSIKPVLTNEYVEINDIAHIRDKVLFLWENRVESRCLG